jgi:hypothetical protein
LRFSRTGLRAADGVHSDLQPTFCAAIYEQVKEIKAKNDLLTTGAVIEPKTTNFRSAAGTLITLLPYTFVCEGMHEQSHVSCAG